MSLFGESLHSQETYRLGPDQEGVRSKQVHSMVRSFKDTECIHLNHHRVHPEMFTRRVIRRGPQNIESREMIEAINLGLQPALVIICQSSVGKIETQRKATVLINVLHENRTGGLSTIFQNSYVLTSWAIRPDTSGEAELVLTYPHLVRPKPTSRNFNVSTRPRSHTRLPLEFSTVHAATQHRVAVKRITSFDHNVRSAPLKVLRHLHLDILRSPSINMGGGMGMGMGGMGMGMIGMGGGKRMGMGMGGGKREEGAAGAAWRWDWTRARRRGPGGGRRGVGRKGTGGARDNEAGTGVAAQTRAGNGSAVGARQGPVWWRGRGRAMGAQLEVGRARIRGSVAVRTRAGDGSVVGGGDAHRFEAAARQGQAWRHGHGRWEHSWRWVARGFEAAARQGPVWWHGRGRAMGAQLEVGRAQIRGSVAVRTRSGRWERSWRWDAHRFEAAARRDGRGGTDAGDGSAVGGGSRAVARTRAGDGSAVGGGTRADLRQQRGRDGRGGTDTGGRWERSWGWIARGFEAAARQGRAWWRGRGRAMGAQFLGVGRARIRSSSEAGTGVAARTRAGDGSTVGGGTHADSRQQRSRDGCGGADAGGRWERSSWGCGVAMA
ncbi:hypothetical protein B0H14DRAFT_2597165 [Mycena olivaceomarginata]|nr:hypothetical protein B0H14DRAFT_2597165 [Mycena olivaceomarginata]